jgi:iron complex outermembrane receptor protein
MGGRIAKAGALLALALAETARAQEPPVDDRIVVVGERRGEATVSLLADIGAEDIAAAGGSTLAEAVRLAPGVVVRTNSRGETLAFFPASGERETVAYLGAAPLNVPWDNRVDLAILPASAVDLRLARGAGAVAAGMRASAGRIDLSPVAVDSFLVRARAEAASGPAVAAEGALGFGGDVVRGLAAAVLLDDAGARVADPSRTPFSQPSDKRRTNDDLQRLSLLGYGALELVGAEVELTALFSTAEQGVPPESDRDPAASSVRFWRYPRQNFFAASAESEWNAGSDSRLGAAIWGQIFDQRIDSFTSSAYDVLEESQFDSNAAIGGRLFWTRDLGRASLTLDASASRADHRERVEPAGGAPGPEDFYREVAANGGAALSLPAPGGGLAILRAGADAVSTPETAGRPRQPAFLRPFAAAEAAWPVGEDFRLGAQIAFKSRPPTLRELYGVALGRFLPNPDLEPETSLYGEINGTFDRGPLSLSAALFVRSVKKTLEQRSVVVGSETLRQRFNLEGSTAVGATLGARVEVADALTLSGDATLLCERPRGDDVERLTERPAVLARIRAEYAPGPIRLVAEGERLGAVWSLDGAGDLARRDGALLAHFRAAYAIERSGAELYLFAENALDAHYEPQAGLPIGGRRIGAGMTLKR